MEIFAVGKDKDAWVTEGVEHYRKLLSKHANVSIEILRDVKSAASLPPSELTKRQAALYGQSVSEGTIIALSDKGKKYNTLQFAQLLEKLSASSGGRIVFLIGGPYGLDDSILDRADLVLSLSPLTFSHQLVRLILLEQLYRGFNILSGGSYHK